MWVLSKMASPRDNSCLFSSISCSYYQKLPRSERIWRYSACRGVRLEAFSSFLFCPLLYLCYMPRYNNIISEWYLECPRKLALETQIIISVHVSPSCTCVCRNLSHAVCHSCLHSLSKSGCKILTLTTTILQTHGMHGQL